MVGPARRARLQVVVSAHMYVWPWAALLRRAIFGAMAAPRQRFHPRLPICLLVLCHRVADGRLGHDPHTRGTGHQTRRLDKHAGQGRFHAACAAHGHMGYHLDRQRLARHVDDPSPHFKVVADAHRRDELHSLVGSQQALIASVGDRQVGRRIVEQLHQAGRVDLPAFGTGIARAEAHADERLLGHTSSPSVEMVNRSMERRADANGLLFGTCRAGLYNRHTARPGDTYG